MREGREEQGKGQQVRRKQKMRGDGQIWEGDPGGMKGVDSTGKMVRE